MGKFLREMGEGMNGTAPKPSNANATSPVPSIAAIIFLGNPGAEYEHTRHNAGRLLAAAFSVSLRQKFKGLFSPVPLTLNGIGRTVYFLLPETYMNLSGESAAALLSFYNLKPENCLIVHDEIELPLGAVALKWSGGLGGHNGLRSLKNRFGTADFWRLRIGVSRPLHDDIAAWVLSSFTLAEQAALQPALALAKDLLTRAVFGEARECKLSV
jgi:PTH1 family peptidyl-tRNA hydrolase